MTKLRKTQYKAGDAKGAWNSSHAPLFCTCKVAAVWKSVKLTVKAVSVLYDRPFPVPQFLSETHCCAAAFKLAKNFFNGLLDGYNGEGGHLWTEILDSTPEYLQLSIASTLVSGKKLLPDPCPMEKALALKRFVLSSRDAPVQLDARYKLHIFKRINKMFRVGWDSSYGDFVEQSSLRISGCIEKTKSCGGVAACGMTRDEFRAACHGVSEITEPHEANLDAVVAKGKLRIITKTHAEHSVLRPLHTMLYSHISRFDWLLRGEANPTQLDCFRQKRGLDFVSGDYESATDNLSKQTARWILQCVLRQCNIVPEAIRRYAIDSLNMILNVPEPGKRTDKCSFGDVEKVLGSLFLENQHGYIPSKGQLMGSLLSFPLLCLQNYLAWTFLVPCWKKRVVRINGDDIVWQGAYEEYLVWAQGLPSLGMYLSAGKTFVHKAFFSINSTYFWALDSRRPRLMPCFRLGMLRGEGEALGGIGQCHNYFCSVARGRKGMRIRASTFFLKYSRCRISRTGRSVTMPEPKGLGINTCAEVLQNSGLWRREVWYRTAIADTMISDMPTVPSALGFGGMPEGWVKVDSSRVPKRSQKAIKNLCGLIQLKDKWDHEVTVGRDIWSQYSFELRRTGLEDAWRGFATRLSGRLRLDRLWSCGTFKCKPYSSFPKAPIGLRRRDHCYLANLLLAVQKRPCKQMYVPKEFLDEADGFYDIVECGVNVRTAYRTKMKFVKART